MTSLLSDLIWRLQSGKPVTGKVELLDHDRNSRQRFEERDQSGHFYCKSITDDESQKGQSQAAHKRTTIWPLMERSTSIVKSSWRQHQSHLHSSVKYSAGISHLTLVRPRCMKEESLYYWTMYVRCWKAKKKIFIPFVGCQTKFGYCRTSGSCLRN